MKVLVVGNGAREHTLVWKLARSHRVTAIYAAPGNAGTALIGTNLNIKPTDIASLAKAVKDNQIELIVVGPEAPLAEGIIKGENLRCPWPGNIFRLSDGYSAYAGNWTEESLKVYPCEVRGANLFVDLGPGANSR